MVFCVMYKGDPMTVYFHIDARGSCPATATTITAMDIGRSHILDLLHFIPYLQHLLLPCGMEERGQIHMNHMAPHTSRQRVGPGGIARLIPSLVTANPPGLGRPNWIATQSVALWEVISTNKMMT